MGLPTGFQFSITAIGSMVMQSANNGLGSICVSGFTAGMRIKQFTMCPFDAFGTAASVFCSQNLGAGKADRIKKGFWGRNQCRSFVWIVCRCDSGLFRKTAFYDLYQERCSGSIGCFCQISALYGILLLESWNFKCGENGHTGTGLFRQNGFVRCNGNDCIIVSMGFAGTYGYTAICFADQTAWVSACIYIVPTCILCMKKSIKMLEKEKR